MHPVNVGIVGCGTICDAYLSNATQFDQYRITTCADIDRDRAESKAAEYGIEAVEVPELLDDPAIDIVLNLTPPTVHAEVCTEVLEAEKHVYTEKPFATTVADADAIRELAADRGLFVGSAPDTFLGAGLQTCRTVIDEGRIGRPVGATAIWTSSGHETWHPNPDLYYQEGGGPLFDMGPYYVTALVFLLGPARRVAGSIGRASDKRTITSEPRHGETVDVEVPTHEAGVVDFESGAIANVLTSFDVQDSTLPAPAFELYGTDGTLRLTNPNNFDGTVQVSSRKTDGWEDIPYTHEYTGGRGVGVADMALAIRSDWDHRTSGELAEHVLEVLSGIRSSSTESEYVALEADCDQPAALPRTFPDGIDSSNED
ncbi:oxidoreductase (plasmid) [Halostagnicola larsenii XH-48]|uniref:Oxidoreductase n=1 Tax=Halostagnicola larsenii XH-48 TaxID=797299 RepID=W0JSI9_9EURY|nr:Gfo/Idh/MocA family oxidoreductase [Halostagnicola larsenii]AHG01646.1 oxidoreductase [Halostagnicola larsenii XH-48]